jgi:flavin-dependent dehydrogenase
MIPLGGPGRNNSKQRVMLVGDAAGFVDSFTGEGIYFAIKSGIIAGETAIEAIRENNFSNGLFATYNQKCKDEINDNLGMALKFSNFVYPNVEHIIKLMSADPYLFEKYILVGRGDMTYKKYKLVALIRLPISLIRLVVAKK